MENITDGAAKTAQKFPWGFILCIMGGLLGNVTTKYFSKDAQQIKTLQDQVTELRQDKLAVNQGCAVDVALWRDKYLKLVDYSVNQQRIQDSTNRAKLQAPNLELIKAINKIKR